MASITIHKFTVAVNCFLGKITEAVVTVGGRLLPLKHGGFLSRAAPDVPEAGVRRVADREQPEPMLGGIAWPCLAAVALDRAPSYRGVAVGSHADAMRVHGVGSASYRPLTGRLVTRCATANEGGYCYGQGPTAGVVQLQERR